jgi:ATP-binding cassette subfamily F protein uup
MIYDYAGNYSDYRTSQKQQDIENMRNVQQVKTIPRIDPEKKPADSVKKKFSFKEKKEFEQLTAEIELLEREKAALETALSGGAITSDELINASNRMGEIISMIDEKADRWLELSDRS